MDQEKRRIESLLLIKSFDGNPTQDITLRFIASECELFSPLIAVNYAWFYLSVQMSSLAALHTEDK